MELEPLRGERKYRSVVSDSRVPGVFFDTRVDVLVEPSIRFCAASSGVSDLSAVDFTVFDFVTRAPPAVFPVTPTVTEPPADFDEPSLLDDDFFDFVLSNNDVTACSPFSYAFL